MIKEIVVVVGLKCHNSVGTLFLRASDAEVVCWFNKNKIIVNLFLDTASLHNISAIIVYLITKI